MHTFSLYYYTRKNLARLGAKLHVHVDLTNRLCYCTGVVFPADSPQPGLSYYMHACIGSQIEGVQVAQLI